MGAFALCLDAGGPKRRDFCLRPKDSAEKRVLFSCYAAPANTASSAKKQNLKDNLNVIKQ
jgi:hypothetical protein